MYPVLEMPGFEVSAYRLSTILALATSVVLTVPVARRRGLGLAQTAAFLGFAIGGALAGARLLAATTADDSFRDGASEVLALRFGDMAMFGGIAGGSLSGFVVARWLRQRPERLADHAAPAIGIGIALLRVGCLLAGCCFGRETNLPWGITYPEGSLAHLQQRSESIWGLFGAPKPVHPVQVYEMVAAVALAGGALWILRRRMRDGTAFAVVVGGYALARLAIHPYRVAVPGSTPEWFYPSLYLAVAVAAAAWLLAPAIRLPGGRAPGRVLGARA